MSGDIILSKSWRQQQKSAVGVGAITLSMRTSMYFLSSLLESRRVPGTINRLPKPCYQHCGTRAGKASSPSVCTFHLWLLSCFLISILFTVQSCPIIFICFSSSCRSTCSTFPIRYSSLQFNYAHHDGNSHTPQPASAFVALWRGIGWSVSCHKGHATGVMAGTPRFRVISLNGGRPNFVGSILREFHGLKIHCRDL